MKEAFKKVIIDSQEKKYDKIKEQTIKQEEAENINADSIRKDMNREFID